MHSIIPLTIVKKLTRHYIIMVKRELKVLHPKAGFVVKGGQYVMSMDICEKSLVAIDYPVEKLTLFHEGFTTPLLDGYGTNVEYYQSPYSEYSCIICFEPAIPQSYEPFFEVGKVFRMDKFYTLAWEIEEMAPESLQQLTDFLTSHPSCSSSPPVLQEGYLHAPPHDRKLHLLASATSISSFFSILLDPTLPLPAILPEHTQEVLKKHTAVAYPPVNSNAERKAGKRARQDITRLCSESVKERFYVGSVARKSRLSVVFENQYDMTFMCLGEAASLNTLGSWTVGAKTYTFRCQPPGVLVKDCVEDKALLLKTNALVLALKSCDVGLVRKIVASGGFPAHMKIYNGKKYERVITYFLNTITKFSPNHADIIRLLRSHGSSIGSDVELILTSMSAEALMALVVPYGNETIPVACYGHASSVAIRFRRACIENDLELVKAFLSLGYDPHETDLVAYSDLESFVYFLQGNKYAEKPLRLYSVECFKLLINHGFDVTKTYAPNGKRYSLLHLAVASGAAKLIPLLLYHGANPFESALLSYANFSMWALIRGNNRVIDALIPPNWTRSTYWGLIPAIRKAIVTVKLVATSDGWPLPDFILQNIYHHIVVQWMSTLRPRCVTL